MTRFLYRRNLETGEECGTVDVSRYNDRAVEKIMLGMLRNMHPDWIVVDDTRPAKDEPA